MNLREQLIVKLAGLLNINLLGVAYKARGIGNSVNFEKNGELNFLSKILPGLLEHKENPTIFDIGQNKGDYTQKILDVFPSAKIHGFEPNNNLSEHLEKRFSRNSNIILNRFGLGAHKERRRLYTCKTDPHTGHASVFGDVITELHNYRKTESQEIELNTLNEYCKTHNINQLDFVKIDVEGNELNVLKGASDLLNSIKVIQFEFNEMNIISNTFFKDFYDLMEEYKFFRILPKGLYPLGKYSSKNEIFTIQNIIAVHQ